MDEGGAGAEEGGEGGPAPRGLGLLGLALGGVLRLLLGPLLEDLVLLALGHAPELVRRPRPLARGAAAAPPLRLAQRPLLLLGLPLGLLLRQLLRHEAAPAPRLVLQPVLQRAHRALERQGQVGQGGGAASSKVEATLHPPAAHDALLGQRHHPAQGGAARTVSSSASPPAGSAQFSSSSSVLHAPAMASRAGPWYCGAVRAYRTESSSGAWSWTRKTPAALSTVLSVACTIVEPWRHARRTEALSTQPRLGRSSS